MNNLNSMAEYLETSTEILGLENELLEFGNDDEDSEQQLRQLELHWKASTSTRRFRIKFRIPFFKTYFFSAAIRPFIEGWDDQIAEPFEAPPDEAFQHDPTQHP